MSVNHLSQVQTISLCDIVRKRSRYGRAEAEDTEIAQEASEAFGRYVSPLQAGRMRQRLGIRKKRKSTIATTVRRNLSPANQAFRKQLMEEIMAIKQAVQELQGRQGNGL
jgi:hypothetical protein